ncbi:uncharacterized protein LOC136086443 [Hydra vulgaris]|uniref:Uncharacterized protein LOC136086443 n=1 Tax=Hydra vulgaris TaxID=6087 RepID=A0ABM4CSD6_HYDVU
MSCLVIKTSLVAVRALLFLPRPYFPCLPKDPRTLLNTPRKHVIKRLASGGEYSHIGLEKGIQQVLQGCVLPNADCLEVQFSTDGLPLFKSSSTSLWPILGMVKNNIIKTVFVIGVFCGREKSASAIEFFEDFITETLSLLQNGLIINGKHFTMKIHSFVCDAPARAFVKGIK